MHKLTMVLLYEEAHKSTFIEESDMSKKSLQQTIQVTNKTQIKELQVLTANMTRHKVTVVSK